MGVALKGVAYRNGVSSLVAGEGGGAYRGRSLKCIRSLLVEAPGGGGVASRGVAYRDRGYSLVEVPEGRGFKGRGLREWTFLIGWRFPPTPGPPMAVAPRPPPRRAARPQRRPGSGVR